MKNLAIITGASSGVGKQFAKAFDAGVGGPLDEIWLIARREDRLKDVAERLKTPTRIFALDLCLDESFDVIERALQDDEEVVNVQWLVNDAGFGKFGAFSRIPEAENIDMVRLNCLAVVQMCYHCLMYMHAGSRIINMSSVAAFVPQSELSIYSATKRFVLDFSRSLDFELSDVGIHTTAVCPKFMHTEFLDDPFQKEVAERMIAIGFEDVDRVVRKSIEAAVMGKDICIPSFDMKVVNALCKVLPVKWAMKAEKFLLDNYKRPNL